MSRDPQWWAHGPGGEAWRGFGRRLFVGAVVFLATLVLGGAVIALALLQVVPERWLAVALAPLVVVALVALTARFWMRTWRPVRHLIDAAGSLADGDYSRRVESTASPTMRPVVASFNKMAERLERADEQRRQLLADVGHELRTPLTVVRGEIEAMIDGVHPPDAERLELLLEEVAVMERLLTDLRTLSLAEGGALALHREPTDVAALLGDVADGYRRMAAEAGVAVALDVDEAVGEVVLDPVRIREVLSNLVINALRAMPQGGELRLTARPVRREMLIEVADSGSGIGPDEVERVFDRFRKGSTSSGSGLGLTISRDLVEAHGGSISLDSSLGVGTVVRVLLPRVVAG